MNRVFIRGCEAEYLDSIVRTEDFCPKSAVYIGGSGSDGDGGDSGKITPDSSSDFELNGGKQGDFANGEKENIEGVSVVHVQS